MERFLKSLAAVIAATQRQILTALIRQLVLVIATAIVLSKVEGAWWCVCLTLCVACLLWAVFLAYALKWQSEIKLDPPWRAIGVEPNGASEHRLELHLLNGRVQVLRVPGKLITEVTNAAREAGLVLVSDYDALSAIRATSVRLSRISDLEALIPSVPTSDLREELRATLARLREVAPPGCDDLLFALRRDLEREEKAQRKTPLSTPIYEHAIKEKLAAFAKLLS